MILSHAEGISSYDHLNIPNPKIETPKASKHPVLELGSRGQPVNENNASNKQRKSAQADQIHGTDGTPQRCAVGGLRRRAASKTALLHECRMEVGIS